MLVRKINIDKQILYELYVEQNKSTKEIATLFNTSAKTVRLRLHEYGIKVKQSCEINRKYSFNEHYFDTIDNECKAYLLGFICADGWIANNKYGKPSLLGIMIQQQDIEIIEYFKNSLNHNKETFIVKNNAIGINFHSVQMATTLFDYGVIPNKSLTLNIANVIELANIDDSLIPSFLLGYFDGDGGIYSTFGANKKTLQWSCGITGTLETCLFLQQWFGGGHIVDEHSKNGNTYTFKLSGINITYNGLKRLYETHKDFCLSRKKNKFLEMKSLLNQR